jgi:SAM-dependent methyltransferase
MKKIDNIEYFDVEEISKRFLTQKSEEVIKELFEEGKISGKKIDDKWFADEEAIDSYTDLFMNERYFTIGPFKIDLTNIEIEGRILDIGGGGEGIIGQLKGQQVIAIDPSKRELEEAPKNKALNIIMDAKDLKFLDNTFDSVTSFFTLMYIPKKDHMKIFKEIHRVLKSEGELILWDLVIPNIKDSKEEIYIITLKVQINESLIDTGYGTRWNKEQDANYFIQLGKTLGFNVLEKNLKANHFYLKLKKI